MGSLGSENQHTAFADCASYIACRYQLLASATVPVDLVSVGARSRRRLGACLPPSCETHGRAVRRSVVEALAPFPTVEAIPPLSGVCVGPGSQAGDRANLPIRRRCWPAS